MSRLPSSLYIASVTRLKFNGHSSVIRFLSTDHSRNNHYDILDVTRGSSQSEIKDAYYKLSKQYHPDRNPGDDNASDKFRKITEAYDVLSNVDSKRDYDRSLAIKDAKSSPYSPPNYRTSTFREVNRNTGKPIDSEDYTQFYKNRQAQLGRHQFNGSSSYNNSAPETSEEIVNPFNPFIDPQTPPISKPKTYKYYSQSGWEDPGEYEPDRRWEIKNDVTTPSVLLILGFLLSAIYYIVESDSPKYCSPPKS